MGLLSVHGCPVFQPDPPWHFDQWALPVYQAPGLHCQESQLVVDRGSVPSCPWLGHDLETVRHAIGTQLHLLPQGEDRGAPFVVG